MKTFRTIMIIFGILVACTAYNTTFAQQAPESTNEEAYTRQECKRHVRHVNVHRRELKMVPRMPHVNRLVKSHRYKTGIRFQRHLTGRAYRIHKFRYAGKAE